MNISFISPAVFVKDIEKSRKFYEEILDQKIEMDNGRHIAFKGGFSIWQGDLAYSMIYGKASGFKENVTQKSFELYFETIELEAVWKNLSQKRVNIIHDIHEHPWGQRGFRIYDPDGHIIEVSEPLSSVVQRLLKKGLSVKEIAEQTSIPEEMVRQMVGDE